MNLYKGYFYVQVLFKKVTNVQVKLQIDTKGKTK